jgi:outer membrane lipoprotein-sorting protein
MRFLTLLAAALAICSPAYPALNTSALLARVRAAEAGLTDFQADMVVTQANKKTISGMGEGYSDIMKLENATVAYKKPDKIRYIGSAIGVKVTYIQNGYTKLVLASMIRHKENVKNSPGKRQDSLDMGFLSSRLWSDNTITSTADGKGNMRLNLDPKFGGNDKRHTLIWVEPKTLRLLRVEKYLGSGELRLSMAYSDFQRLTQALPIATKSTLHDSEGKLLGTVQYKNLKVNTGLSESLFSLSSR